MIRMPHFLQDARQHFLLSPYFFFQKFSPPFNLLLEYARPRLPRKRDPCQKRRPVPLRRPFLPFQRFRQSCPPFRRRCKRAAHRPCRRLIRYRIPNHPRPRQFLQRVINLRPRNPRPIPYLPPLQFQICLISMHRPLRQQAQQHQIRRRQRRSLLCANASPWLLRESLRTPRLCVIFSLGTSLYSLIHARRSLPDLFSPRC
jgi:hypothetical protein